MDQRKETGRIGEKIAAEYLQNKGWRIVDRNRSSRLGELDLICEDGNSLVFVEVRTTCGKQFGFGFQSVDFRKQQKVRRLALQ